jgi:hypothetical protein
LPTSGRPYSSKFPLQNRDPAYLNFITNYRESLYTSTAPYHQIPEIEIKKRFPSSKNLVRIAEALGVKPANLFAEEDEPEAAKVPP